jgi:hypothetical protein
MHQQRPHLRTVAATHPPRAAAPPPPGVGGPTRAPQLFDRSSAVVAICASGAVAATSAFLGTSRVCPWNLPAVP